MDCITIAQSSLVRAISPSLSIVQASAIAPVLGTNPNVGRYPVTPQRVDGEEIDPKVSEPIAKGTHPAATAAAEPAEEPLDPWLRFHGFRVRPPNQISFIARAPKESFATNTAPASSRRCTIVASIGNV